MGRNYAAAPASATSRARARVMGFHPAERRIRILASAVYLARSVRVRHGMLTGARHSQNRLSVCGWHCAFMALI